MRFWFVVACVAFAIWAAGWLVVVAFGLGYLTAVATGEIMQAAASESEPDPEPDPNAVKVGEAIGAAQCDRCHTATAYDPTHGLSMVRCGGCGSTLLVEDPVFLPWS